MASYSFDMSAISTQLSQNEQPTANRGPIYSAQHQSRLHFITDKRCLQTIQNMSAFLPPLSQKSRRKKGKNKLISDYPLYGYNLQVNCERRGIGKKKWKGRGRSRRKKERGRKEKEIGAKESILIIYKHFKNILISVIAEKRCRIIMFMYMES